MRKRTKKQMNGFLAMVFTVLNSKKSSDIETHRPCGRFCNAAGHVPQVPSPDNAEDRKNKKERFLRWKKLLLTFGLVEIICAE